MRLGRRAVLHGHYHRRLDHCDDLSPSDVTRPLRPVRAAYHDWRRSRPPDLGALRRTTPIDPNWGYERGTPIDRVFVDRFVGERAADVRGRVLEIAAPDYTTRYGTDVQHVDILMAKEGNPDATIVGRPHRRPPDPERVIRLRDRHADPAVRLQRPLGADTLHRILRPGGVLLATVPGITKISRSRTRVRGMVALHRSVGAPARRGGVRCGNVEVETYGNVLDRGRVPLRARRARPPSRGARRPRSALRGDVGIRAVKLAT